MKTKKGCEKIEAIETDILASVFTPEFMNIIINWYDDPRTEPGLTKLGKEIDDVLSGNSASIAIGSCAKAILMVIETTGPEEFLKAIQEIKKNDKDFKVNELMSNYIR
ncbi:MAG: hypothetical protein NT038_03570 [Euryarchaeota archaeon]|nr:hypothetical protein [Euryarchaeota archaeon]